MKSMLGTRIGDKWEKDSELECNLWYRLVQAYTSRSFTRSTDRLKAIAGLARKWNSLSYSGKYTHGIWRQDIGNGISWQASSSVRGTHAIRIAVTSSNAIRAAVTCSELVMGISGRYVYWYWKHPDDLPVYGTESIQPCKAAVVPMSQDSVTRYWPLVPRDWHLPVTGYVLEFDGAPNIEVANFTLESRPQVQFMNEQLLLFLYDSVIQTAVGTTGINIRTGEPMKLAGSPPDGWGERQYYFLLLERVDHGWDIFRRIGTYHLRWKGRKEDLLSPYLREMRLVLI
jgi:hypothetical protein